MLQVFVLCLTSSIILAFNNFFYKKLELGLLFHNNNGELCTLDFKAGERKCLRYENFNPHDAQLLWEKGVLISIYSSRASGNISIRFCVFNATSGTCENVTILVTRRLPIHNFVFYSPYFITIERCG